MLIPPREPYRLSRRLEEPFTQVHAPLVPGFIPPGYVQEGKDRVIAHVKGRIQRYGPGKTGAPRQGSRGDRRGGRKYGYPHIGHTPDGGEFEPARLVRRISFGRLLRLSIFEETKVNFCIFESPLRPPKSRICEPSILKYFKFAKAAAPWKDRMSAPFSWMFMSSTSDRCCSESRSAISCRLTGPLRSI